MSFGKPQHGPSRPSTRTAGSGPKLRSVTSTDSMEKITSDPARWMFPIAGSGGLAAKRTLDVFGAALGLVLLSPLMVAVAVLILVADGRPILFRQQRVGLDGRRIMVSKFRTMVRDAESRRPALHLRNEIRGHGF